MPTRPDVPRSTLGLSVLCCLLAVSGAACGPQGKSRDAMVRGDRQQVTEGGFWIYNDFATAQKAAQESGKPLLIVFRCIPCEACAQLDSEIVERDPKVRSLLEKFVCLRIVHANGLDLSLFQFDYDQSFAAFLMNADKTIYGRFGTRSHETESKDDVTLEGFAAALTKALELHAAYPENRAALAGKQPQDKPDFPVPEQYPTLLGEYTADINYEGQVAMSCIHCHQVAEAQRRFYRDLGKAIPEKLLFPHPHPKALGLIMDPHTTATVKEITPESPADAAGLKAGDELLEFDGQPLLSMGDIQWVLHNTPETADLPLTVRRDDETEELTLKLAKGWRQRDQVSWRGTSWALRRMVLGGMVLKEAPPAMRQKHQIKDDQMALVVEYLGLHGPHGLAIRSGFRKGDLLVAVAGKTNLTRETDLLTGLVNSHKVGDSVPFQVIRNGRRETLSLKIQK